MHFLVDFENTQGDGLIGAEYLLPDDSVTIFFSKASPNIGRARFNMIVSSGCRFDVCKLQNTGKNALDFYIVSRLAELFGEKGDALIGIVSRDQGFSAVCDYWRVRAKTKHTGIWLRPNIALCIRACSNDNSERHRRVLEDMQEVSIEEEWSKISTQHRFIESIRQQLPSEPPETIKIVEGIMKQHGKNKQMIYRDSLREFGQKRGLAIYSAIKKMV